MYWLLTNKPAQFLVNFFPEIVIKNWPNIYYILVLPIVFGTSYRASNKIYYYFTIIYI